MTARRYTIWAGRPLADQPAGPGRRAVTGRHAQTFRRSITGTRRDAMAVAARIPDDPNHALVTVDAYLGWDLVLREHQTERIAKRAGGVWLTGQALADHDEAARVMTGRTRGGTLADAGGGSYARAE